MVLVDVPDEAFTDDFSKASDTLQNHVLIRLSTMFGFFCMYADQTGGMCSVIP